MNTIQGFIPPTFVPSATLFRKYKHYSTYKGKIIINDGSHLSSIILEKSYVKREDAVSEAKKTLNEIINKQFIGKES